MRYCPFNYMYYVPNVAGKIEFPAKPAAADLSADASLTMDGGPPVGSNIDPPGTASLPG